MSRAQDHPAIAQRIETLRQLASERRSANDRDKEVGRELRTLGVSFYRLAEVTGMTAEGARTRYTTAETPTRKEAS